MAPGVEDDSTALRPRRLATPGIPRRMADAVVLTPDMSRRDRAALVRAKREARASACPACGSGPHRLLDQALAGGRFRGLAVCEACGAERALDVDLVPYRQPPRKRSPRPSLEAARGAPLGFRGVLYEPTDEGGVVLLFGTLMADLGMEYVSKAPGVADAVIRARTAADSVERVVEFEYLSRSALTQGNDLSRIEIIVCWRDNWKKDRPPGVEIIALEDVVARLRGRG